MDKHRKLLGHILTKAGDHAVSFEALCKMLIHYGFAERIKGDHHIFSRVGVEEILNLQPVHGKAKAYQIRQVRTIILRYGIHAEE
jgi:hypothetical protein